MSEHVPRDDLERELYDVAGFRDGRLTNSQIAYYNLLILLRVHLTA